MHLRIILIADYHTALRSRGYLEDLFVLLGGRWGLFLFDMKAMLVLHIGTVWVWKELDIIRHGAEFAFFARGDSVSQAVYTIVKMNN